MKAISVLSCVASVAFAIRAKPKDEGSHLWSQSLKSTFNLPHNFLKQDWGKLERGIRQKSNLDASRPSQRSTQPEMEDICDTPGCVTSAASFLESMDLTVNPCDDFYSYVCGSWIDEAVIPDGSNMQSTFAELSLQNAFQVHKALSLSWDQNTSSPEEIMAKKFYTSCMDTDEMEMKTYEPLFHTFDHILGTGLPLFGGKQNLSPQLVLEQLLEQFLLETNIFGINVERNPKNADKESILILYQPELSFPPLAYNLENITNQELVMQLYQQYIAEVVSELGSYWSFAKQMQLDEQILGAYINSFIQLEFGLGKILKPEESIEDSVNVVTLGELATLMNESEFPQNVDIIQAVKSFIFKLTNMTLTDESKLMVPDLQYFKQLNAVLNSVSQEDLVNYLLFGQALRLAPYTTETMRALNRQLQSQITGNPSPNPRWKICVDHATLYFGAKVSQIYADHYHAYHIKESTQIIIERLRTAFAELIHNADWMDKETRETAMEKLSNIKARDGYSRNLTATNVAKVYKGLETMESDEFLLNIVKLMTFWGRKEVNRVLIRPSYLDDINKFGFDSSLVNAMYAPQENSIWIPLGIQKFPFYVEDRLQALNYGGLGMVLGHELTHGFDNTGARFDKYGNFQNWWSAATEEKFKEKQQCFIEQYSNYTFSILEGIPGYVGPTGVDGEKTLGENIADNGGIREAFSAYHQFLQSNGLEQEKSLPGLKEFSPDQLFFIGYTRAWCETKTIQALVTQLAADVHPPGKVRVLATLSNYEEFAKAFQCEKSDGMVNDNPCRIW